MPDIDPSGHTVIILAGEFAGEEGTCLGRAPGEKERWAVSPNSSNQIVNLLFEVEFGVILNPGQESGKN
jgi:hypothetical protein